jgi:hypothetical protein
MKAKLFGLVVTTQLYLLTSNVWADETTSRPEISNIGGEDHSPGATLVIVLALVIIGFGVGFLVGRRTSKRK